MNKEDVLQNLVNTGIVPVVRANSENNVLAVIEALIEGGIPIAEITMTVPNAIAIIEQCSKAFGHELTVGAGTVTDARTCLGAIDVGSRFVVTPTVETDIITICKQKGVCVIGGGLTPTEILSVWEAGADAVKVFPAKAAGGPAYIRMLREPFPHIPLVPTGGVNLETLAQYFEAGATFVGSGGDLVNKEAVESGKVELIRQRSRQYLSRIRDVRARIPYPSPLQKPSR
ncbi:MAG: bifunctional 4-hydroxy-2-oxoglutarate aldolase/2-dehydro-3-deoxy-phosphogluconate aldolase [Desulfobacteraceae bacterium]|jgi:2-dehydro-3-deoxyphosphogluconate aldolase/(4S)-4-hydroxy-2-oxoglutarate aldolase